MRLQPAYDVTLAHGGNTVRLVPSFRAAIILEQRQGGYVALLSDLSTFKLQTVHAVIRAAAIDADAANRLIGALGSVSLRRMQQITLEPLVTLISRLMNVGEDIEQTADTKSETIAHSEFHKQLFKLATGWLRWTPEQTYAATIPEIALALEGHIDLLKATSGTADEDDTGITDAQRQANIEAGLDPEFDRDGLAALRGMGNV